MLSWKKIENVVVGDCRKRSAAGHAYAAATHDAMISVELLRGSRVNQCRADLEHDRHPSNTTLQM